MRRSSALRASSRRDRRGDVCDASVGGGGVELRLALVSCGLGAVCCASVRLPPPASPLSPAGPALFRATPAAPSSSLLSNTTRDRIPGRGAVLSELLDAGGDAASAVVSAGEKLRGGTRAVALATAISSCVVDGAQPFLLEAAFRACNSCTSGPMASWSDGQRSGMDFACHSHTAHRT